jgi:hypothetical protein
MWPAGRPVGRQPADLFVALSRVRVGLLADPLPELAFSPRRFPRKLGPAIFEEGRKSRASKLYRKRDRWNAPCICRFLNSSITLRLHAACCAPVISRVRGSLGSLFSSRVLRVLFTGKIKFLSFMAKLLQLVIKFSSPSAKVILHLWNCKLLKSWKESRLDSSNG